MGKLIVDGNQVYEIDEECMRQKKERQDKRRKTQNNSNNQLRKKRVSELPK